MRAWRWLAGVLARAGAARGRAGGFGLVLAGVVLVCAGQGGVVVRAAPMDGLAVLHGGADDQGFELAQGTRRFEFPRDHGPHPSFRHEWWYFTGRLRAAAGEQFGFELTFFRLGVMPPEAGASAIGSTGGAASGWQARQVYAAHFAVTDLSRKAFHARARYAREALGLGMAQGMDQGSPLEVRVQDWSLVALPASAEAGASPAGDAHWRLQADDGDYAIDLDALVAGTPVLNGNGGLSVKAAEPGAASWYYSLPRLPVHGSLKRGGKALAVSGEVWLDREWGSGGLGSGQQGWDWHALQLSDGSALMFYTLRGADGRPDPHSAGTFVGADGRVQSLQAGDVSISATRSWDSPRGGRYPAGWQVRVPGLGLDLAVTPVLADQELATQPRYWEGAVDVKGTRAGQGVGGQGYVELVGYARSK